MNLLIISSSLSNDSRSLRMATYASECLQASQYKTELISLADFNLPFCNGGYGSEDRNANLIAQKIRHADGILIATPIYNYNVNAALKNLIELTGKSWIDKVVGFMCSAGGKNSYMSVMPFANNLMFDFRSIIIPRFVYSSDEPDVDLNDSTKKRIDQLIHELIRFVRGLKKHL
jgi:FMN reductase